MLEQGLVFAVGIESGVMKMYDARQYEMGPFETFIVCHVFALTLVPSAIAPTAAYPCEDARAFLSCPPAPIVWGVGGAQSACTPGFDWELFSYSFCWSKVYFIII